MSSAVSQRDFSLSSDITINGINPAQSPQPFITGFVTVSRDDWSDSVINAPDLENWKRYAYGRSATESPDSYGSLQNYSGLVIYQRAHIMSNDSSCHQFYTDDTGRVLQKDFELAEDILQIQNLVVSSDDTITQFNFLLLATPVPYSYKNVVDSDIYLRISNYSGSTMDSSSVVLYIDNVLYDNDTLTITPFYVGNGGLDITWSNTKLFGYGKTVDIVWQMTDDSVPANNIIISYWFSIVEDLVGPRILNKTPVDDTTDVAITTSIIFDVIDYEEGIDISSLKLYVNNKLISSSDITITAISNGYRILYIPPVPFIYGDVIPIAVFITDLSERVNETFVTWSFTTVGSRSPTVINMEPSPCDVNVNRVGNISFEIVDDGHGIEEGSIVMGINNEEQNDITIIPIIHRFQ
jgi:hypothetical protein